MNIKLAIVTAALGCLWVFAPLAGKAAAAEIAPRKQSLTIPIAVGQPTRSIDCQVKFGPSNPISALAFAPDGKTLVVGGYQEVLVWDLENAKLSKRIAAGKIAGSVRALAFLGDGPLLAVGEGIPHGSGAVRIFDVKSGEQTHVFEEPQEVVHSLAVSPDGKLLAAAGAEVPVRVWSVDDKKLAATIKEHGDWVLDVSFSGDGKLLATASADRTLKLWEVGTWQPAGKLPEGDAVRGAAFSPDGQLVALAAGGGSVRTYWKNNAKQNRKPRPARRMYTGAGTPMGVVWSAKGNKVYVPCSDGTLKAFDGRNGRLLATFTKHADWVHSAVLSPDGTKLASGSADGTVKLWNTADAKLLATFVQLAPGTDQWLIVTAAGYFSTSSADALTWKTGELKTPAGEITGILHKPELVQKAISGEKTEPPALK